MRRHRALMVAALCAFAPATGCFGSGGEDKEIIRTVARSKQYLDEVIRGAGLTARAADEAPFAVKLAVAQAESVAKIRQIIDDASQPDSGVKQVCGAIGVAADSNDFIPPPPRIDAVLPKLRQNPGALPENEEVDLVERLQRLTGNQVVQLLDAACPPE